MATYDLVNDSSIVRLTNLISASSCNLSNVTYVDGIFTHSANTTAMVTLTLPTPTAGHKYYGRCYQKSPAGSTFLDNRFEYYSSDDVGQLMVFANMTDTNNEWILSSAISSVDSPSGTWQLRSFTVNGTAEAYRKELMIVDLTEAFGSGNEPDKNWCDINIPFFEGSVTILKSLMIGDILNCPYSGAAMNAILPKGVYKLEVWGAQGGSYSTTSTGGNGGYSIGTLTLLEKNTTIFLYAGGTGTYSTTSGSFVSGGFNGGGAAGYRYGGSGGGASDIRIGEDSLYSRVIVAGGGGGGWGYSSYDGGVGGGTSGGQGTGYDTSYLAGAGTQTAGGAGNGYSSSYYGSNGTFGAGGDASSYSSSYNRSSGGGGGWYGGGGSGFRSSSSYYYRGGGGAGGGSGYVYTSSTASNYPSGCLLNSSYYLTDATTYDGSTSFIGTGGSSETGHSGDGYCRITVLELYTSFAMDVNIGGTWKEADSAFVDIDGVWKEVEGIWTNIGGSWKESG